MSLTAAVGWCAPSSYAGEVAYEWAYSPPAVEELNVVSARGERFTVRGPEPAVRPVGPPSWWTASSGNRYPAAVLEPDFPWPLPVPTLADYRTWTPSREQRARWAEEDLWLRTQLQLCVTERSRS